MVIGIGPASTAQRKVSSNTFKRLVWPTPFTVCDLFCIVWFVLLRIFFTVLVMSSSKFRWACDVFLVFFYFFLSPISSHMTRMREKINKKNYGSISKLWRQHYWYRLKDLNKMNSTTPKKVTNMNGVGYTRCPKISRLTCFLVTRVTHSNHCRWLFLVLLNLFHRDLFNSLGGVVVKFQYVSEIFFFYYSLFFILICVQKFCNLRVSEINIIYNSLNHAIFQNILYCYFIIIFFYYAIIQKKYSAFLKKLPGVTRWQKKSLDFCLIFSAHACLPASVHVNFQISEIYFLVCFRIWIHWCRISKLPHKN